MSGLNRGISVAIALSMALLGEGGRAAMDMLANMLKASGFNSTRKRSRAGSHNGYKAACKQRNRIRNRIAAKSRTANRSRP